MFSLQWDIISINLTILYNSFLYPNFRNASEPSLKRDFSFLFFIQCLWCFYKYAASVKTKILNVQYIISKCFQNFLSYAQETTMQQFFDETQKILSL